MIQGGWNADFSSRDLKLTSTTFDGGLAGPIIDFYFVRTGKPVIVLDGINFINGKDTYGAVSLWAAGDTFMRTSLFNCVISGSEANSSGGGVLQLDNSGTSESDRTIANSVISGNSGSGIYTYIRNDSTARWRIINTTISNNSNIGSSGQGIDVTTLDNGVLNAHVFNSILWGNDQQALDIWGIITFNVDHSNLDNVKTSLGAIVNQGAGILNVDPLFIDPTAAKYHLQAGSPMIDAGTNVGVPVTDFEGETRLSGAAVDIGADEVIVPEQ